MIPLHVHSSYSPLAGLCHPKELCQWAFENALEALAITDTNGFYGLHFFLQAAKEHNIRPIIGLELIFENYRLVALCLTERGYEKLCSLISKIQLGKIDSDIFLSSLKNLGADAAVFTDQKDTLLELRELPHLYFEISPGFFNHQDVLWARNLKIPLLPTTRARYIDPKDHFYFLLIQAIKENKTLSSLEITGYNQYCRLYSSLESSRLFTPYLDSIKNTYKLARMCWSPPKYFPIIFPKFEGMDTGECDQLLRQKSFTGIAWRYPNGAHYKVIKRLEHELKVISGKGFSSYFLVVEDIVKNSPRTCGRGSGASSLVSFLLGITHVDPIKHNLFFDRFLNPERVDPPDIDIDFPWDERDHILDYVFLKYPGHSAMVANHNTMQGRSSLREVAKVMGIPVDEINYIIKRFPRVELNLTWQGIVKHADRLQNLFKTLSVHPGGVVITPKKIENYVPLQLTPKGVPVIQWEKRQTKSAGLVKIDLLGNRSLAVIRDAIKAVNENCNKNYLYQTLDPLEDLKTKQLIKSGQTMGVFYIESPATRQLLERMNTHEFEHIVIASSI
ncbi:MAG: DNA polymerase III subunit alpha, partial [Deltaproteobacteria bacterium]